MGCRDSFASRRPVTSRSDAPVRFLLLAAMPVVGVLTVAGVVLLWPDGGTASLSNPRPGLLRAGSTACLDRRSTPVWVRRRPVMRVCTGTHRARPALTHKAGLTPRRGLS